MNETNAPPVRRRIVMTPAQLRLWLSRIDEAWLLKQDTGWRVAVGIKEGPYPNGSEPYTIECEISSSKRPTRARRFATADAALNVLDGLGIRKITIRPEH